MVMMFSQALLQGNDGGEVFAQAFVHAVIVVILMVVM